MVGSGLGWIFNIFWSIMFFVGAYYMIDSESIILNVFGYISLILGGLVVFLFLVVLFKKNWINNSRSPKN